MIRSACGSLTQATNCESAMKSDFDLSDGIRHWILSGLEKEDLKSWERTPCPPPKLLGNCSIKNSRMKRMKDCISWSSNAALNPSVNRRNQSFAGRLPIQTPR